MTRLKEIKKELECAYECLEHCVDNEEFAGWQRTIEALEKELEELH